MSSTLQDFYKRRIPPQQRKWLYDHLLGDLLRIKHDPVRFAEALRLRLRFLFKKPVTDYEQAQYFWAVQNGFTAYPYEWVAEYEKNYPVFRDEENGLSYVMHERQRLYVGDHLSEVSSQIYKQLLIEQDLRSAHCYLDDYSILQDKVLLDVGAAEGIFTLEALPYVKHAYIFECDERWLPALEATFKPWKDKVTIVRKYVGDENKGDFITLDHFFHGLPDHPVFLKMDIEGAERNALAGAAKLLTSGLISGSVCIYHKKDDPEVIPQILSSYGIPTRMREGYIYYQNEFRNAMLYFNH